MAINDPVRRLGFGVALANPRGEPEAGREPDLEARRPRRLTLLDARALIEARFTDDLQEPVDAGRADQCSSTIPQ